VTVVVAPWESMASASSSQFTRSDEASRR
jgi:hypothetical protein